jgi:integrase
VKKSERSVRRPFNTEELRAVFGAAGRDPFWRYMVCGGTYTGLRLGDLTCLKRKEIDLPHNQLCLVVTKTDETIHIPLAVPFRALLERRLRELGRGKPDDYLWPDEARIYIASGSPPLSNDFYEKVLVPAGLATKRTHQKQTERKEGPRKMNPLSFHSFRHSFVSMLKLSGASQHVAKELAGHSSDAVSNLYTTIPIDVLRKAVERLPEVTG